MHLKHDLLAGGRHLCWILHVLQSVFLSSGRFWPTLGKNVDETYICGQKWSKHGTCIVSAYKSSISLTYLRSGHFHKTGVPYISGRVFASVFSCCGKPFGAARDIIWITHENSIVIRGKVSAGGIAKNAQRRKWKILSIKLHFVNSLLNVLLIMVI